MLAFNLEMNRFQRNIYRNELLLQKSMTRSSYSGLPIGVSTHKSKPSIKPASNVAAYDNRRGKFYYTYKRMRE